ncbi:MaoC family dehydratase [Pararhizobium antarcticum]|uniref:Enoyl-CoA hydratase n=1 Tax=Pararhizobium antarcticum TaxID=1798805 RepID=A0A657LWI2_9HYPH|nr:MaoC family dehydratase [Pararhizobium antarcticum]OJF96822.1 enoyl-CoA hydratase [Pararhizobium antarcticum]OJF98996.1 enoyl-CoA hydratase [Rhizobium sp. 58]
MQADRLHIEDFTPGRAFALGPTPVSADEIVAFASEFDPQPMHLSQADGAASILGGLAASGWHTSALMMRMLCDSYIGNSASEGSPGIDSMEWKKPVLAGDTLSGQSRVTAARVSKSRPEIGIVTFRATVTNQRGDVVAICEYANLIRCRPSGEAA